MKNINTLKGTVLAQYGSIVAFHAAYCQRYGKITYAAIRNRLNDPDSMTIKAAKEMISLLTIDEEKNPYSFLLFMK